MSIEERYGFDYAISNVCGSACLSLTDHQYQKLPRRKAVVGRGQWVYSFDMELSRPLSDDEILRTLAERDKTFERDEREAEPWQTVKADLLRSLKQPVPR